MSPSGNSKPRAATPARASIISLADHFICDRPPRHKTAPQNLPCYHPPQSASAFASAFVFAFAVALAVALALAFALAFAFAVAVLSVIPSGNLLLPLPLPFFLSFPQGICFFSRPYPHTPPHRRCYHQTRAAPPLHARKIR
jgi:hypothetical protein